jgi:hypothetical protein
MSKLIRQSVVVHRLQDNSYIEFELQKTIRVGTEFKCMDDLADLLMKLQARQIDYKYDDLTATLRVNLTKRNATRVVEYSIIK